MSRTLLKLIYEGELLPVAEVAKRSGISACCIRKRYAKGERGPELFRPGHRGRFREEAPDTEQQIALRAKREAREAAERAKLEFRLARQRRERDAKQRAAAEHAAAFSKPLIDDKLLRPKERAAIAQRVRNCGQRCWRTDGGAVY
jgi:hypothetical protein